MATKNAKKQGNAPNPPQLVALQQAIVRGMGNSEENHQLQAKLSGLFLSSLLRRDEESAAFVLNTCALALKSGIQIRRDLMWFCANGLQVALQTPDARDALVGKAGKKGRRKDLTTAIRNTYILQDYKALRSQGLSAEQATAAIAEKFNKSEDRVRNIVQDARAHRKRIAKALATPPKAR